MSTLTLLSRVDSLASTLGRKASSPALLVLRLIFGWAFLRAGLGKLTHYEGTVRFFADLGLPLPGLQAGLVGSLEFVGGAMLMLGLLARPMAAALASTMVVAILTADRGRFIESFRPGADHGLTDVVPVVFLLAMSVLFAFGPGRLSLDALLLRKDNACAA